MKSNIRAAITAKTDPTLDPALVALADAPLPNEFAVSAVDKPMKSARDFTIEQLRAMDPAISLRLLEAEKLIGAEAKAREERSQNVNMQENLLREVQEKIRRDAAIQHACGRLSHMREDNRPAVGGQYDGKGTFVGVCSRCFANFVGIGDGPGQLPPAILSRMDMNTIGSAV